MAQTTEPVIPRRGSDSSDAGDGVSDYLPWKAVFPDGKPRGYWELFLARCAKASCESRGFVSEKMAKQIWLMILSEYEEYQRMGMWIPAEIVEEHRAIALTLNWLKKEQVTQA